MTHTQPQPEQTVAEILKLFFMSAKKENAWSGNIELRTADAKAALNRQALATALRLIGSDKGGMLEISKNSWKAELRQAFQQEYGDTDEQPKPT